MGDFSRARTAKCLAAAALPAALVFASCGQPTHAPFAATLSGQRPRRHDAGTDAQVFHIPPPALPGADAPGICGRTVVPVSLVNANLYFVLDASGSMATPMDTSADAGTPSGLSVVPSRYDAARLAIRNLLITVGHRVSYGAALFPADDPHSNEICPAGTEVFATRPGDDLIYATKHEAGPKLTALLDTLAQRAPNGLTPTAASITALKSNLLGLDGKTYAFLLTDGAPNCDAAASCDASGCTTNIEGDCPEPGGANCCDPRYGIADNRWCLDDDPTVAAVADLNANGVETFVIGMPGTEVYGSVLDRMAVAGGTARDASPKYYSVQSSKDLNETLERIGLGVAISCDLPLGETPPDKNQVNVYFDQTVVPLDDANGWTWTGDDSIRIVGSYCDVLRGGSVLEVQVVAGCPSVTR